MKELTKKIQKEIGVAADGVIGPITLAAIAKRLGISGGSLVEIALGEVGILETSKNQGAGIEKYWSATTYPDGYKNREPYCAAFVCWCVRQAGLFSAHERPKTARAFGFEEWAKENGLKLVLRPSEVKAGDIVVFTFSHVGIATSDSDKSGNFTAVEGNTDAAGSREGGGVWKKTRNVSAVRSTVNLG